MIGAAAVAAISATVALHAGSAVPPLAVSPSGSDGAACTQAQPCASFDRAYHRARPGQRVVVAAGSYGAQTVTPDPSKRSGTDVVFAAAPGAVTHVHSIEVSGSHVTFSGLRFDGDWPYVRTRQSATDVTFLNDRAPRFDVLGSTHVSFVGGVYGPENDASNEVAPDSRTSPVPRDILLDRVTIHGYHRTNGVSHVDCLHSWGVNGLIVRRSRFYDCEHFDIFLERDSTQTPTNVLIENDFLQCCRSGYYSIRLADIAGAVWKNVVVRNDSSDKPFNVDPKARIAGGVTFVGNVAPGIDAPCGRRGLVVDHNVWTAGKPCGPHDVVAPVAFRAPSRGDFHLLPRSPAIARGDAADHPRVDIDGDPRPSGRAPDAGADQVRVAAAPLLAALYVSPGGNDGGPCTQAAPCRGFDAAFARAAPGGVVLVESGTYPDQDLLAHAKSGTAPVTFRPAPGASAAIGEVRVTGGAHLVFTGLTMDDYYIAPGSDDITFRNDTMHFFFIRSATNIRMLGGSVGGFDGAIPATIGTLHPTDPTPRNVLIDGVHFHDMTRAANPSGHMECLFVQGVDGLVVRRSRFDRCDVMDVFFKQFEAPQYRNVRLDDDFFGRTTDAAAGASGSGYYSVFFAYIPGADPIANVSLDHDSFAQGFHFDDAPYTAVTVTANVATLNQGQCTRGVTYAYNVFDAARCGATDRRAPTGFVDPASGDLHLRAGAPAVGEDRSGTAPATDIDGQARPTRWAADAGADQRIDARLSLAGSIGGVRLGAPAAAALALVGPGRTARRGSVPVAAGVQVTSVRVPGGALLVGTEGGRVVAVGTTSAYFTTSNGLGVGTPPPPGPLLRCGTFVRRGDTLLRVRRDRVSSLWLVRAAATACARRR